MENELAVKYIRDIYEKLVPVASVSVHQKDSYNYYFSVRRDGVAADITFGYDKINDLQQILQENYDFKDYRNLENFIKFKIYITLGKAGFIPEFSIAKQFLDEKRDWHRNIRVPFENEEWFYKVLESGLKDLKTFLDDITKKYGSQSDIEDELECIDGLLDYYNTHKSFEESGATEVSLGYLKAAAVAVIIGKEKKRAEVKIQRVLLAKDKEIYDIVDQLRKGHFLQIKMPDCIFDYYEHTRSGMHGEVVMDKSEVLMFIACGQSADSEKKLGFQIRDMLRKKFGLKSFLAEKENDLESLNTHIFRNLGKAAGFIAVLHRRKGSSYDTSVWINQEVGIAAYLRASGAVLSSFVLYEDGADVQGLIKWTNANPPRFSSDDDAISQIEQWVSNQNFKIAPSTSSLPSIKVLGYEERGMFGSSRGSGREGHFSIRYFLSFMVRNESDTNVCLENVSINHELLGVGTIDSVFEGTTFPLNIDAKHTEKVNLRFIFANEVGFKAAEEDIEMTFLLEFSDRVQELTCKGYFSK